jgi:hypothetical protein
MPKAKPAWLHCLPTPSPKFISAIPEYADAIHVVAAPRSDVAVLKMTRAATIEGRVLLAGQPFGEFPLRVKGQGWAYPWGNTENWRTGPVAEDGTFRITNVPSLDMLGESAFSLNLDPQGQKPGTNAEYVPQGRGWDLMLTRQKNGRTERWLSHVRVSKDRRALRGR